MYLLARFIIKSISKFHTLSLSSGLWVRSSRGIGLGLIAGAAFTLLLVYVSNRWIDKSIYPSPIWQLHHKSTYASLCARMGPTVTQRPASTAGQSNATAGLDCNMIQCSSPFTEALPPRSTQSVHGGPPSVNELSIQGVRTPPPWTD